jgi:hypothetical protein
MLLFMDGQAHYDTARIGMKYTTVSSENCAWSIVAEGRFGNALKRTSTTNGGTPGVLSIAPLTTRLGPWTPTVSGVCGFAVKVDNLTRLLAYQPYTSPRSFFVVGSAAGYHLDCHLEPSGVFTLHVADTPPGDNTIATSIEGLSSGTWMYIEFKWLLHATAGNFQIRVNGLPVMNYTGNTLSTAMFVPTLPIWNFINILGVASDTPPLAVLRMCDLYLADLDATLPDDVHDFLGDGIIETIMPNGVGAVTGWTPSGSPTNWDATNDRPAPDDDATYVATTPVGTRDLYQFEDIPADAEVKGIHVNVLARKVDEGGSSIAPLVHPTTIDYRGPTQGVASTAYDRYVTQAWDLNPETGAKFTAAEINAGQWGVEKMT